MQKQATYKVLDYYPFGFLMPSRQFTDNQGYRFSFNGKEDDAEWGNGIQDYGFRLYSKGLGKFLSVDPLSHSYPYYTPYQFAGNMPIWAIDLDGLEEYVVHRFMKDGKVSKIIVTAFEVENKVLENNIKNHNKYKVYRMVHNEDGSISDRSGPELMIDEKNIYTNSKVKTENLGKKFTNGKEHNFQGVAFYRAEKIFVTKTVIIEREKTLKTATEILDVDIFSGFVYVKMNKNDINTMSSAKKVNYMSISINLNKDEDNKVFENTLLTELSKSLKKDLSKTDVEFIYKGENAGEEGDGWSMNADVEIKYTIEETINK